MHKLATILLFILPLWLIQTLAAQDQNSIRFSHQQIDSLVDVAENSHPEEMIRLGQLIHQSLGDQPSLQKGSAFEIVGLGLYNQNKFLSAIAEFEKAIEIFSLLSDSARVSRMYNRIGISYSRLRQYSSAMENYRIALRIREHLADTLLIGSTLNNIATCLRSISQEDAALKTHLRSYELFKAIKDSTGQATSLNNIGLIHFDLKHYDTSLYYFSKALEIKVKLNNVASLANTYGNIGRVYTHLGDKENSIKNLKIAAKLFEKSQNTYGQAFIYTSLGQAYLNFNQPELAYEFITKSQSIGEYKENSSQALESLKLLSDYFWAVGEYKKSRELLNEYTTKTEQLFSDRISNQVAELTFMYDNDRLDKENKILEVNLELEKVKLQKVQYQQIALYSISILLLTMLVVSLIILRRFQNKKDELTLLNSELNHLNNHLETIVENRTRDLLSTLKKAQESDKQKSAFLANMSHEVRTPLNSILGFTKLLEEDNLTQENQRKFIGIIRKKGKNLLQVINDIITMSLLDLDQVEVKPSPFNLNQLLFDLYNLFNSDPSNLKDGDVELKIKVSLNESRSNIIADPNRLEQILTYLIDNAIKLTPKGTVEFGYVLENNHTIKFFVKDLGKDIPYESKSKLFSLNSLTNQQSPNFTSSALGFYICKGLVELLNGNIWFDSTQDAGTTFYFTIPFIESGKQSSKYLSKSSMVSLNLNFKDKIILVVEDDLISYQFIEALLRGTDAQLIHAKNGEDAIEIVKIIPNIDLVMMDMRLPFIDGYQTTKEIKSIKPSIKIIAQTANVMSDDKDKCLSVGCNDYLSKPIDPDEFLRLISQYLSNPVLG